MGERTGEWVDGWGRRLAMQTDSGKRVGRGVKGQMDGENNGQGVVQGPDLHCCLTRHSMAMTPPTQWEYSPCLAPMEQRTPTRRPEAHLGWGWGKRTG